MPPTEPTLRLTPFVEPVSITNGLTLGNITHETKDGVTRPTDSTEPLELGRWDLNGLILTEPGGGLTTAVTSLVNQVLRCRDAIAWFITREWPQGLADITGALTDADATASAMVRVAADEAAVDQMLKEGQELMRRHRSLGVTQTAGFMPSAEHPSVVMFVDAGAITTPDQRKALSILMDTQGHYGVHIIVAFQISGPFPPVMPRWLLSAGIRWCAVSPGVDRSFANIALNRTVLPEADDITTGSFVVKISGRLARSNRLMIVRAPYSDLNDLAGLVEVLAAGAASRFEDTAVGRRVSLPASDREVDPIIDTQPKSDPISTAFGDVTTSNDPEQVAATWLLASLDNGRLVRHEQVARHIYVDGGRLRIDWPALRVQAARWADISTDRPHPGLAAGLFMAASIALGVVDTNTRRQVGKAMCLPGRIADARAKAHARPDGSITAVMTEIAATIKAAGMSGLTRVDLDWLAQRFSAAAVDQALDFLITDGVIVQQDSKQEQRYIHNPTTDHAGK